MAGFHLVQRGFNYGQDGPGNRLVYHLAGCNMRCPWCSNPEAMDPPEPDRPGGVAVEELVAEVVSARPVLIDGGGVTFTGGEPTLQWEALTGALALLREAGVHTAIETNATHPRLEALLPLLSLLIMDLKHWDDVAHRQATGVSNGTVIRNLRVAAAHGLPVWVRTPLIGGFNTGEEQIRGFVELYKTIPHERCSFELLPYHEYGRDKWARSGKPYTVQNAAVDGELVERYEEAYRKAGLRVIRT